MFNIGRLLLLSLEKKYFENIKQYYKYLHVDIREWYIAEAAARLSVLSLLLFRLRQWAEFIRRLAFWNNNVYL